MILIGDQPMITKHFVTRLKRWFVYNQLFTHKGCDERIQNSGTARFTNNGARILCIIRYFRHYFPSALLTISIAHGTRFIGGNDCRSRCVSVKRSLLLFTVCGEGFHHLFQSWLVPFRCWGGSCYWRRGFRRSLAIFL